jgi:hypothetical protein
MKAFASRRIISILVLATMVMTSACGPSGSDDTKSTEAATTSLTQSTEAATASLTQPSSSMTDACAEYSFTVGAIASSVADASALVGEVFGVLAEDGMAIALYSDVETLDTLIDDMEEFSDEFAQFSRILPAAPPAWAEADRHIRISLSTYESTYASIAVGFRVFKAGDFQEALSIFEGVSGELEEANAEVDLATAAIPPDGC